MELESAIERRHSSLSHELRRPMRIPGCMSVILQVFTLGLFNLGTVSKVNTAEEEDCMT